VVLRVERAQPIGRRLVGERAQVDDPVRRGPAGRIDVAAARRELLDRDRVRRWRRRGIRGQAPVVEPGVDVDLVYRELPPD